MIVKITSPKNIPDKWFGWTELSDLKKLDLVYRGEDERGYDDIEYSIQLLDRPTKPYLQGKLMQNERWYKHTRSDVQIFDREWGTVKTIKEVNKRLREGFVIGEFSKFPKQHFQQNNSI